ncbi:MAG TPA: UbiA family prenyltransferase [Rugosimonospora sp.]
MRGLLRACHPEPTAAVTLVAALLAIVVGHGPGAVAAIAVAVLGSQLAVGWTNDWLDAPRDALTGRRDKPIPAGAVSRRTVGIGALVAAVATVPLALLSGPVPASFLIVGMICGLLYDWPLKFTAASPVPYLVAFGALAAFVAGTGSWWLILAAALLGGGAHFVNVLPDLADDLAAGVRGLPHRIGATGSWVAGGTLLVAATAALVFGPAGPPSWPGLAVLAAAVVVLPAGWYLARRPGSRAAFRSVLVVALADVILLLVSGTAR